MQVTADGAGDFVVALVVPFDASVGTPHRFTATDGRLSAAGFITAYAPTISVSCTTISAPVSVVGSGWPPSARYAVRSSMLVTPLSGTVAGDGAFSTSFTPPSGVLTGDYQISASVGSLLAEPQTCTLQ